MKPFESRETFKSKMCLLYLFIGRCQQKQTKLISKNVSVPNLKVFEAKAAEKKPTSKTAAEREN
ncbi:CLUMA_CG015991, isoform A [Clunio marinus]|uniref:CLUMA_CG015991, isoform A n=1 Tax=Clunio marinus TaxID=568069 RepID=A0A1J1IR93_9DIPT|nr:CLUMA_CG015991, isoform A [Clunio marinus]